MIRIALIILLFLTNQRFTKAQYFFTNGYLELHAQKDISGLETNFAKIDQLIEERDQLIKSNRAKDKKITILEQKLKLREKRLIFHVLKAFVLIDIDSLKVSKTIVYSKKNHSDKKNK